MISFAVRRRRRAGLAAARAVIWAWPGARQLPQAGGRLARCRTAGGRAGLEEFLRSGARHLPCPESCRAVAAVGRSLPLAGPCLEDRRDNGSMMGLRAKSAHTIPDRPPIRVVPGQQVRAGQRDTEGPVRSCS